MFEKNQSKNLTQDLVTIKKTISETALPSKLKKQINKEIFFVSNELKDLVVIKKQGSYATNSVYKFDKIKIIDLAAIKYVNKKMYQLYDDEIETKDHFGDCWMCELNEKILDRLKQFYKNRPDVTVKTNKKVFKLSQETTLKYEDSVQVEFKVDGKIYFVLSLRTGMIHKSYPMIICDETKYRRSFSLQFVEQFKILNKLLLGKVELLFIYLRLQFREGYTRKQRLYMKHKILSDLTLQLGRNVYLQEWIDEVYNNYFPNEKILDDIFKTNDYYYNSNKLFERVYKSFKLKNLKWVFRKTFSDTKNFLITYLDFAKNNFDIENDFKNEQSVITFWYENNVYIKNSSGSINYTMKKNKKIFEGISVPMINKNVYPSNKEIGNFMLFVFFYKFEMYFNQDIKKLIEKQKKLEEESKTVVVEELEDFDISF